MATAPSHPVTWVGLSATLANAQSFFGDLCGLRPEEVVDIRPDVKDLDSQGADINCCCVATPRRRPRCCRRRSSRSCCCAGC